MTELVFNIKDIFNSDSQDGCLTQYDCSRYHIPAYQRGYKWASKPNGAVNVLLNDLWYAFQAYQLKERKEYYLQYITVKKNNVIVDDHHENCLEVIDGQQRLTTLSIFISVLSVLLKEENISTDKLHYAIRPNFFSDHIYKMKDLEELVDKTWDELKSNPDLNKQDVFYLHSAARHAYKFFHSKKAEVKDFYIYLIEYVKLIVNSVEHHVESETVFKNLNSNKVPLTESELIKGLLITKIGRVNPKGGQRNFKEVLEIRLNLGRHWDTMSRWANQPEIKTFFFNGQEGTHMLLTLTAMYLEKDKNKLESGTSKDYPLFNFYHKYSDINNVYTTLTDIQATLSDWFVNEDTYNLLGFCRFVKESSKNNLEFLMQCLKSQDRSALKDLLVKTKKELLPKIPIKDLRYGEHDNEIHAVLLSMNVFAKGLKTRFSFHEFIDKKWSLEHVFPQSPEGKKAKLTAEQKQAIKEILGEQLTASINDVLDKHERTEDEKQIYYNALKSSSLLNSIGNMCLLTGSDNSSNGCKFFEEKRKNIIELIREGSFVPRHTFDVFSKMIAELSPNPHIWSSSDIETHITYISANYTH